MLWRSLCVTAKESRADVMDVKTTGMKPELKVHVLHVVFTSNASSYDDSTHFLSHHQQQPATLV